MATPGTASARIGRLARAQAVGVGGERALEDEDRQEGHQHDVGVHRRRRQHVHEDEQQPDDDQRDVVGNADALRADGDRRADREDEEQALEPLPHPEVLAAAREKRGEGLFSAFEVSTRTRPIARG